MQSPSAKCRPPVLELPQTPPTASRNTGLLPTAPSGPPRTQTGGWVEGYQAQGWGGGRQSRRLGDAGLASRAGPARRLPQHRPWPLPPVASSAGPGAELGPRAPPTHHAYSAHHYLRLRQEAPQVEGAARLGRAVGPALHVVAAAAAAVAVASATTDRLGTSRPSRLRPGPAQGRGQRSPRDRGQSVGWRRAAAGYTNFKAVSCGGHPSGRRMLIVQRPVSVLHTSPQDRFTWWGAALGPTHPLPSTFASSSRKPAGRTC